ncbi:cytoplasmic tRNA 2-thiolation protein 2-like [Lethenteron reissneri]|uniref:cytoplasmic tRNA 2-thiolation protein 2-like n=1 Tax=Lethenteron reissneri TaxID=7753 RepID=UPI002AB73B1E|nr:cytoplasmic tRNA 2-thiolation protein 2-like [Lethenteron reissneri]XP_061432100.1 cytoplasmic tRNA 2-thiolation protein 2-like [Lethenteron reissneri]
MCQANEDDKDVDPPRVGKPSMGTVCMKCKERRASMLIRVNDPFCRECFREYFVHKFRAVLGKRKVIEPGEKVLVAVSGGASSCTLLAQVQLGLSRESHKRLKFIPGLVHVDEGAACGETVEERVAANARIEEIFKQSGFPYYIVPLEQALRLGSSGECSAMESGRQRFGQGAGLGAGLEADGQGDGLGAGQDVDQKADGLGAGQEADGLGAGLGADGQGVGASVEETESLCGMFRATRTLTAREDLLFSLRLRLLVWLCRRRGYAKAMLGESCTRVAVRILAALALGRGAGLAQDTGFCDDRFGDVLFLRPMRELSAKEVALYVHAFGVRTAWRPALGTRAGSQASITSLTEAFVTELQAEFPSTVSTIYRTGEKIGTDDASRAAEKCALCSAFLDTDAVPASALQAALLSEKLSGKHRADPPPPCDDAAQCSSGQGACCRDSGADRCVNGESLTQALCYGCRLTVNDMDEAKLLPPFVLAEAEQREKRRLLKAQIQEFLLEDDDGGADEDETL